VPRRIEQDHKQFRDVVSGRIRKALKKHVKTGQIFPRRSKNGKISIAIPELDIPHLVFGDSGGGGIARGPGKKGQVIGKDDDGQGKGNEAGEGEGEGIEIQLDLEEVLKFMAGELELPPMKPKDNDTVEETFLRYNSLSLQGPNSLRHGRKTLQQALKRTAASGDWDNLHTLPGFPDPMRMITPQKSDFRYRQYTEHHKPASNAVIFFARDGSGSMDEKKCEIVSDMSWWIDVWIRQFYKKVERVYVWHDWAAQEVDEDKFYNYRYGGGTMCSSAMNLIAKNLEDRFNPKKWNVYVFYFTDGDNIRGDNDVFAGTINKFLGPQNVNFIGLTQVYSYNYDNSLKRFVDDSLENGILNPGHIKTTAIGDGAGWKGLTTEDRDEAVTKAIKDLLGKNQITA